MLSKTVFILKLRKRNCGRELAAFYCISHFVPAYFFIQEAKKCRICRPAYTPHMIVYITGFRSTLC